VVVVDVVVVDVTVVVGVVEVLVDVVELGGEVVDFTGEVAACAGSITDWMTGRDQELGRTLAMTAAAPIALSTGLRSGPPLIINPSTHHRHNCGKGEPLSQAGPERRCTIQRNSMAGWRTARVMSNLSSGGTP
jgi:hypothetical protein